MSDTPTIDAPETTAFLAVGEPTEVETETETTEVEQPQASKPPRAARTDLESDVRRVLDDYVTGALVLPDGRRLTPHIIATNVGKNRGGPAPSSGAVSAALNRWAEIGYITLTESPVAFDDYTEAGRTEGLAALKAAFRARKAAARKAEKAAAEAAAPAPEPAPAPAPEPDDAPF